MLMPPRCDTVKEILFTPRLIAFNESFATAGNCNISPVAVLWHEAISGQKTDDIVSIFYAFLNNIRDSEDIVIWLDNCSGQICKLTRITPRPYLNQMVEVQFTRGLRTLTYKTSFDGAVNVINCLKANCQKMGIAKAVSKQQLRGISEDRKQTILIKLGQILLPNRLHFWENLPDSQSQDAIDDA
ncbi:hypothetical protein ILUMI_14612 [Ignelater luminosus]|uniref:Uncharacterized protein n=1 Tax=Ignelater luminosus TaxID=2038154 RepID=A0A8K0CTW6_IGNLU|nr:hypothetical protein ILUMI_14612 [Ignelater luminosus]